ncbi:uncharacterized mitochondrial protein AtMg00810-like [Hevea brasiliensis]|uniref:uncharacterized mitochondrial protein AtMg00810-like n=1 Tax=Hevea brasiliensis TaxID=3981 RepID=UPI0025DD7F16|nr:uncharacterized mitochondrial protein AtMg00810-like [Hevea brasiliensis]
MNAHSDLLVELVKRYPEEDFSKMEKLALEVEDGSEGEPDRGDGEDVENVAEDSNDPSLFTCHSSKGIIVLLVYVDDMLLTRSDREGIHKFKQFLQPSFQMKDLGQVTYFLGLEVSHSAASLFVNQHKYIADLIKLTNLIDDQTCSTPMELNLKLKRDDGEPISDPTLYRRLVGSLIYLTTTRPDISYVVQVVSQFMSDPRRLHLTIVHRIIRYLKGTMRQGLFFPSNSSLQLVAFADADYPDSVPISWKCKKQDRVAKSSTEAEYRAMSSVSSEVVWLR